MAPLQKAISISVVSTQAWFTCMGGVQCAYGPENATNKMLKATHLMRMVGRYSYAWAVSSLRDGPKNNANKLLEATHLMKMGKMYTLK